jgi:hypothetical protein
MAAIACKSCSNFLGRVCNPNACCPEDRPYPLCLSYTWLLNLLPGIASLVMAFLSFSETCADVTTVAVYLILWALFACINCVFSLYLYRQFEIAAEIDNPNTGNGCCGCCTAAVKSGKIACEMIGYDIYVCGYSVLWVAQIGLHIAAVSSIIANAVVNCTPPDIIGVTVGQVLAYVGLAFTLGSIGVVLFSMYCERECHKRTMANPHVSDEDIWRYKLKKQRLENGECCSPYPDYPGNQQATGKKSKKSKKSSKGDVDVESGNPYTRRFPSIPGAGGGGKSSKKSKQQSASSASSASATESSSE